MGLFGNGLKTFFLGTDEMDRRAQAKALQQAALMAAGLIGPAPGAMRAAPISDPEGNDISAAFAPQMEQGPARPRSPAEVAAGLAGLAGSVPGFNPKPFVDLAQYSRPNLMVTPSGEAIDQYDPSNAGRTFPKMGEGIAMGSGGTASAVPGYARAAGDIAGATTGAQEQQKAAYDLIDVPMPDGSTVKMPRLMAGQILAQHLTGQGAGGGGLDGLGHSQSPAAKVTAEGNAKTAVDRAAAQPQQISGLQDQARTTNLVVNTIDRVLPKIGAWTAGLGANLSGIKGTPAHDLQADLDTIRANVGFDALAKMRANSPTGGALGAVSERENALLQAVLGSLDSGQSPPQLAASLKRIRDQLYEVSKQRADLYKNTYSGQAPDQQGAPAAPRTTGFRSRIISVQ